MIYTQLVTIKALKNATILAELILPDDHYQHALYPQEIPLYILMEAGFQTAGRLLRERHHYQKAGIVIGCNQLEFMHSLQRNRSYLICASYDKTFADIEVYTLRLLDKATREVLIPAWNVKLKPDASIVSDAMNKSPIENCSDYLEIIDHV